MRTMKLSLCLVVSILICLPFPVFCLDAITRIELRNSYSKFEQCMENNKNDITECVSEFNNAVAIYKKALKLEPDNKTAREGLLVLCNTFHDIANTFNNAAEKKRGIDPGISQKYYRKAVVCFEQLIKLYPSKESFKEQLKNAMYYSKYEEVEANVVELKARKRLDYALLTLHKLKAARDSFNTSYGEQKRLNNILGETLDTLESKVNTLFAKSVKNWKPDDMPLLFFLVKAQEQVVDFTNKNKHHDNLGLMQNEIIEIAKCVVDDYRNDYKTAMSDYQHGKFAEAGNKLKNLLAKTNSFPDYGGAKPDLRDAIEQGINNFSIEQFRQDVSRKEQIAKATSVFLAEIEKGKDSFNHKDWHGACERFKGAARFAKGKRLAVDEKIAREWLTKAETQIFLCKIDNGKLMLKDNHYVKAYRTFKEAAEFADEKQLREKTGIAKKWLKKAQKSIDKLDDDDIKSTDLAILYYKPLSYAKWLRLAKQGKFSRDYVLLSGSFQQKVGKVVILKNSALKFDFLLDNIFIGQEMNSVGLILRNKRLLKDGDYIQCIGKFDDIEKFRSMFGVEIQIPVFKVIWNSL